VNIADGEVGHDDHASGPDGAGVAQAYAHPSLACFVLLAKFLGTPADPEQIAHERGKGDDPYSLEDLSRIAKRLDLIARIKTATLAEVRKVPLPALSETAGGDAVILLKIEDESLNPRYLIQRGDAERPEVWSGDQAAEKFTGRLLLMTSREAMAGDKRPFDISWFIPALVKYRKPLRDVLIGSFFLQLMGLVSPIFFQLVIDKVLVHQSMTTLDVLAFGLAVVLIFETLMSGLRNWLFAHTTNRVDSELSSKMFRHLLNLPISYFEARRVRVRLAPTSCLATIREPTGYLAVLETIMSKEEAMRIGWLAASEMTSFKGSMATTISGVWKGMTNCWVMAEQTRPISLACGQVISS
jgi:ATP-binding cassette, subfamily B, bacterial HlyB/CyaB